jgi:hypothetical protein
MDYEPLKRITNLSLPQIASGWYNFIKGDPQTKLMMQTRLAVCDSCDQKIQLSLLNQVIIHHINEEASLYKCKLCTCPLATKTASPKSVCPLKKWEEWNEQQSYW